MRAFLKCCPLLALLMLAACGGDDEWDLRLAFNASPSTLPAGGLVTLAWSSRNATRCTADGGWTGARTAEGSETIRLGSSNQTFTLSCTDGIRTVVNRIDVTVTPA